MKRMVLKSLEAALNVALRLDPATKSRLADVDGKLIRLTLTDADFVFYVQIKRTGVFLLSLPDNVPDAELKGTTGGLLRAGLKRGKASALFQNKVELSGDLRVAEAIKEILQNVNVDWEEHLSRLTGDVAAHQIAKRMKGFWQYFKKTGVSFEKNVKEFLQEEKMSLPSKSEVEDFYEEVILLRDEVEKLEIKLLKFFEAMS